MDTLSTELTTKEGRGGGKGGEGGSSIRPSLSYFMLTAVPVRTLSLGNTGGSPPQSSIQPNTEVQHAAIHFNLQDRGGSVPLVGGQGWGGVGCRWWGGVPGVGLGWVGWGAGLGSPGRDWGRVLGVGGMGEAQSPCCSRGGGSIILCDPNPIQ